jgi:N-acetylglucosamine kinase-like BadF-type ATPase
MDVEGAHWDAFGPKPGVLLAVGTGSIAWGRDGEGREIRVGGWGTPLSEEGSGYWLGMEGLRAVVRAADGRDPPTRLTPDLLGALGFSDHRELVPYVAEAPKGEVGALAPLVLEAAAGGDPAARTIVDAGLKALGRYLEAVGNQWRPSGAPFPLALAGGLLEKDGLLREPLLALASGKGAEIRTDPVVPVRGAARLALELARVR